MVAVPVHTDRQEGYVRVVGRTVQNILTGQGDDRKTGGIYGQSYVKLYRRSNGEGEGKRP